MNLKIILEKTVEKYVPLPASQKAELLLAKDLISTLQAHLKKINTQNALLIFCSLKTITEFFASLKKNLLEHKCLNFIIFVKPAEKIPNLAKFGCEFIQLRRKPLSPDEVSFIIEQTLFYAKEIVTRRRQEQKQLKILQDIEGDQENLIIIGRALSTEKDIDSLFRRILYLCREITGADAGSIYIVEKNAHGDKQIRVKFAETFSKKINFEEYILPYNTGSIAGYVAITGKSINIADVYKLSPSDPISFNPSFDYANYYRTKSMLAVPMRNHFDEIIGVIQLINSKENYKSLKNKNLATHEILLKEAADYEKLVVPFKVRYCKLMEAIANQAAIAIENARLISRIQTQFEEFVKASVSAIESRDPATSGHSFRVAEICLRLADAINKQKAKGLGEIAFSPLQKKQLEYAALLHDFGKIYLDPRIFLKGKKLFQEDFQVLSQKLLIACLQEEVKILEEELNCKLKNLPREGDAPETCSNERINSLKKCILEVYEKLKHLNEPSISETEPELLIEEVMKVLKNLSCKDLNGQELEFLDQSAKEALAVKRGSLSPKERMLIEKHVEYSYNFVQKIPWPPEYSRIPEIIYAHHEMLDGSGYPRKLGGKEQIPLESQLIALADIYDALTAHDRPYKKVVSPNEALKILTEEAKKGRLDLELVSLLKKIIIENS